MHYVFLILGVLGLLAAALVAMRMPTDLQLTLAAVCAFGGLALIGIGYIIAQNKG